MPLGAFPVGASSTPMDVADSAAKRKDREDTATSSDADGEVDDASMAIEADGYSQLSLVSVDYQVADYGQAASSGQGTKLVKVTSPHPAQPLFREAPLGHGDI